MFDLPSLAGVDEVVVNEEAVSSEVAPLLIYSEQSSNESATA